MQGRDCQRRAWKTVSGVALIIALAAIISFSPAARADDGAAMAPPDAAQQSSVFNWTDVPQNQSVPLVRATFDQGGYQLYDTAGETIIVPFTNDNLYVMKFAPTSEAQMYFVNSGEYPILYVPEGGYLENASVAGARWYPFPHDYHPAAPVFLGIAPSWDAYIDMGWYPGMYYWGGYWGHSPFWAGGVFVATPGLVFWIGGHPWYGWDHYFAYYHDHPGWRHVGYFHRDYYHWAARPSLARPPFRGSYGGHSAFGSHGFENHGGRFGGPAGGAHEFRGAGGASHSFGESHSFGGASHGFQGARGSHSFGGSTHSFGGSSHGFQGAGGSHSSGGSTHSFGGSSHGFQGAGGSHFEGGGAASHAFGGSDSHSFMGGSHGFQGASGGGGSHSFGGSGSHSFGGGGSHSFGGGSHSSGGGDSHSSGGGSHGF